MCPVYKRYQGKPVKHGSKDYDRATWYVRRKLRGELIHKAIPEARTKRDAEEYESKLVSDRMAQLKGEKSPVTFAEFADTVYLKYVDQHNKNWYVKGLFVAELRRFFGTKRLADITAQDCRDFQHFRLRSPTKQGKPRAAASVNKETSTLSKLFNLAVEQEVIDKNPMRLVKKLKEAPPRRRILTQEQRQALWTELQKDTLLFRLAVLATNLPLRRGQLLAISPDAIDLQPGLLRITPSKGRQSRIVPLNNVATNTIKAMVEDGQLPIPVSRFEKRWHKALAAVGLYKKGERDSNYHWHDFRTLYATDAVKAGASPYDVQKTFGHGSMDVTNMYLGDDFDRMRDVVNRLDVQDATEVIQ